MGFYRQRTKCPFLCSQRRQCTQPCSQCSQRRQCRQLLQPTSTELLQGQAQTHLCTRFAGANSGTAAVALHTADDGVAYPVAVWVYGF